MPMGPKGAIKPDADVPSAEALDALWSWLCDGEARDELAATDALRRFQDMAPDEDRGGAIGEGPDSVAWKPFALALGVGPFERW